MATIKKKSVVELDQKDLLDAIKAYAACETGKACLPDNATVHIEHCDGSAGARGRDRGFTATVEYEEVV